MWAYLRDHNYKISKNMNTNLLLAMVVLSSSIFTYGFETATLSTVQAMDYFVKRFGEQNPTTHAYFISTDRLAYLNSFPLLSNAVGVVVAALISERWGRRIILLSMNCICIGGIFCSLFAQTYAQVLAGRMLIQLHVGMESYLIPMYTAELVPAGIRGSMVALYAFGNSFSSFISSIITNFTSQIDSDDSWKIPVGLILMFPCFVLLTSSLVPESPRWLLRKGRFREAVDSIYYLRSSNRDYPAEEEARLIMETINNAKTQGSWGELLKGTNARRTWIGVMAAAATQLTGQSFASQYGTVFLKSLGTIDAFTGTMIKRGLLVVGCIFVITCVERLGRRPIAVVSGGLSAICLFLMGGLATVRPATSGLNNAILAMTIIFPVLYMVGIGSTMQIVKSELPHTSLRDKATMINWSVANICNFVATFTLPYLLQAPSLEEIDEMMESKVPAWKTRNWQASGIGSRLTELDNGETLVGNPEKLDVDIEHREGRQA
ncbi:low-affinity glucose transporter HXT1 [Thozetella sp. PMI_491]|nr:low-affinity glucose transporter HXT1 [Thozetella sp. PMI_491]